MVRVTGLYLLGDYAVKSGGVQVYYPDTLSLYIIRSIIGVKSSRNIRFSVEANRWRKWADKFANAKTRRIARLVRILGIDSL